jgi:hypothetical protein
VDLLNKVDMCTMSFISTREFLLKGSVQTIFFATNIELQNPTVLLANWVGCQCFLYLWSMVWPGTLNEEEGSVQ